MCVLCVVKLRKSFDVRRIEIDQEDSEESGKKMNANELREMSDEQLVDTLKDICESFFRLKIQAQTERLDAPSELRRHRRLIARIKTVQSVASMGPKPTPADAHKPY